MLNSPAIEVTDLSHAYPGKRGAPERVALDRVSLAVQPGEVFAVLGPNGSGKSTLFSILCGALAARAPQSDEAGAKSGARRAQGSVRMLGLDPVAQSAELRRKIGVVFQNPALDKKLTCRENLELHGMLFGLRGAELRTRAMHWLHRLGLDGRADELAESLSGGMRRRLELAKALLPEPSLLLMDEPSAGLDPSAVRLYWDALFSLRDTLKLTIVLSTHHMGEADRADRLAVFSRGRCVAVDTPGVLKSQIGGHVVAVEPAASEPTNQLEGAIASALGVTPRRAGDAHGSKVLFETNDPVGAVAGLSQLLPGKFRSITVAEPSLEDVFLRLTGKTLGEDEELDKKAERKKH